MSTHITTTRPALGALRLPWCLDKATRTKPISISDQPEQIPDAIQIRVRDVSNSRVRQALSQQRAKDGFSLEKIEALVTNAMKTGRQPEIEDSAGFWLDGELVLMEGCHRTCAIYLLDPPAIELRTRIVADGWLAYFDPRLAVS